MYQYLELQSAVGIQLPQHQDSPDTWGYHFMNLRLPGLNRPRPVAGTIEQLTPEPDGSRTLIKLRLQASTPNEIAPVSLLHENTVCQMSTNWGKVDLGTARVIRRWFEPATSSSWKIEPFPNKDLQKLELDRHFAENEYRRIKLGSIPLSMDDHWFAYFEDNWLNWHRSWTGIGVFKLHIEEQHDQIIITDTLHDPTGWSLGGIIPSFLVSSLMNGLCAEAIIFD